MRKTTESDSSLIEQFLNGDVSAVERLFNRHQDRLYTYIFFLVKKEDVAQDIYQDTFYKVFNSIKKGKYKDDGRFFSWVSRIAHNLVIYYLRDQKKQKMVSGTDQEEFLFALDNKNIENHLVSDQILADVRKIVEFLPDDQREVVIMRNYLDMSFKEIAETTGVSINTALGRMRYAIINLRKLVKEHHINLNY